MFHTGRYRCDLSIEMETSSGQRLFARPRPLVQTAQTALKSMLEKLRKNKCAPEKEWLRFACDNNA